MTVVPSPDPIARLDSRLTALRSDPSRRRRALGVAAILGLGLGWLHWVGLIIGGALVGLTRRRGRSAVLSGVAFGILVLGANVFLTPVGASEFATLRPVNYLTAATGILLPVWGSLVRYVA